MSDQAQTGLIGVLHRLVQKAQFDEAEQHTSHDAINAAFADHLATLSDAEKEGRMAPVSLTAPSAPVPVVPGFTPAQVQAMITQAVKDALSAQAAQAAQASLNAQAAAAVASATQAGN